MSFFKRLDEGDLVSKKVFEKFRDEKQEKDKDFDKDQMEDGNKNTSPHQSTPTNVEGFNKNPEGILEQVIEDITEKQSTDFTELYNDDNDVDKIDSYVHEARDVCESMNTETAAGIIENTSTADVEQSKLDEKVNSEVHIHEAASGEGKGELDLRDSQVTLPDELLPSLNAYVNLKRSTIVHPSANKEQTPMNVSRVGRPSKFKESPFTTKFGSAEGSTEVQTKKFNLKYPFASHPIYDIEDTKITNNFLT
ncbi:hypothetical protein FXO37_19771 [Capsicum annuum]|nr:hypothetical protein FXO37_19771 [Capsicum annuum]